MAEGVLRQFWLQNLINGCHNEGSNKNDNESEVQGRGNTGSGTMKFTLRKCWYIIHWIIVCHVTLSHDHWLVNVTSPN
jgi:hypothetical protein